MDRKKLIYAGIGIFVLLVIYNSTKKTTLVEVTNTPEEKNFDSLSLPSNLKPPYRMADGEALPKLQIKKSLNGISFKPRFDQ